MRNCLNLPRNGDLNDARAELLSRSSPSDMKSSRGAALNRFLLRQRIDGNLIADYMIFMQIYCRIYRHEGEQGRRARKLLQRQNFAGSFRKTQQNREEKLFNLIVRFCADTLWLAPINKWWNLGGEISAEAKKFC
jgi:hypothetical protein